MGEVSYYMQKCYNTNHESVMDRNGSYHIKEITNTKCYIKKIISCQDINR